MDWVKVMTMSLPVLFILGCSPPPPPAPPKTTVFDPLVQSEQRARDVQKTVDQNADSTRKALDTQERGDTTP
jgi:hypothetical protein